MQTNIHIGNIIRKELEAQKRSVNWLADEMGCDASNLRKKIEKPHICSTLLYCISVVLGKDFFAVYSIALAEEKKLR